MRYPRLLVGMESSGTIRDAFRSIGFDAWSCDLLACEGDPRWHIQGDVFEAVGGWDAAIFHPTCTYLTNAAEWAFNDPDFDRYPGVGYHQRLETGTLFGQARRDARAAALDDVRRLMALPIPMIAIENPKGAIGSAIRKPDQVVQPFNYGNDASKGTCLWLKHLPRLRPTGRVQGRATGEATDLFGLGVERWSNQTDNGQNRLTPGADRWRERSRTYPGIANAMRDQWGPWIMERFERMVA